MMKSLINISFDGTYNEKLTLIWFHWNLIHWKWFHWYLTTNRTNIIMAVKRIFFWIVALSNLWWFNHPFHKRHVAVTKYWSL